MQRATHKINYARTLEFYARISMIAFFDTKISCIISYIILYLLFIANNNDDVFPQKPPHKNGT